MHLRKSDILFIGEQSINNPWGDHPGKLVVRFPDTRDRTALILLREVLALFDARVTWISKENGGLTCWTDLDAKELGGLSEYESFPAHGETVAKNQEAERKKAEALKRAQEENARQAEEDRLKHLEWLKGEPERYREKKERLAKLVAEKEAKAEADAKARAEANRLAEERAKEEEAKRQAEEDAKLSAAVERGRVADEEARKAAQESLEAEQQEKSSKSKKTAKASA